MNNFKQSISKWVEKRPFLKDAAVIHTAIYDRLDALTSRKSKTIGMKQAEQDLREGIPMMESIGSELLDIGYIKEILSSLTELANDDTLPLEFKKRCKELAKLADEKIIKSAISGENKDIDGFDTYLIRIAFAKSMEGYLPEIMKAAEDGGWNHDYCPTCGSKPDMAQLKHGKRGRQRYLSCGCCGTVWSYKRIGCPYCATENPKSLEIIEADEEPELRIDVCNECNSYIKTYIGEGSDSVALKDWASIHMDILCNDTEYKKQGSVLKAE